MIIGFTDVRSVVARSALLIALAAALLFAAELTPDPALRAVVPMMAVLVLLQFAPAVWARSPDLFEPPVFTGIVAAFGTAATLSSWYINGELTLDVVTSGPGEQLEILAEKAILAFLIGIVCYYIGYYTNLGVRLSRVFPKVRGLGWDRGRVLIVCFITAVIFVTSYGIFQSRVGVPLFDFTQLAAGKAAWREDTSLSWMMRGIEIGFLPVILFLSWTLAKKVGVRSLLAPAVVLVVMALLASRLGQRGTAVYVVLACLILFHYHRRRIPVALFIGLIFVGIVIANATLEWRFDLGGRSADAPTILEQASDPTTVLADHEGERQRFSCVALIMKTFPDEHSYLMGRSWASIIVAPIPRWLWPDKNKHFEWQDNRIIWQLSGVPAPAPFVGVLYANLSWLGVVLGTLLLGVFHRGLYEWLRDSKGDQNVVLLYTLFLVYSGPSSLHLSTTMQYVVPMWLILRFIGGRDRRVAGA